MGDDENKAAGMVVPTSNTIASRCMKIFLTGQKISAE